MSTETQRLVLVSGCSSGGKSTLIAALAASGYATVAEPGRRIIAQETDRAGTALPWTNPFAFAQRAVAMARSDLHTARALSDPVFFDRGLVDAAVALEHSGGPPCAETLGPGRHYADRVFMAPPWPDIYSQDSDRRQAIEDAIKEHHRLTRAFDTLGYTLCTLPRAPVAQRVSFVRAQLGLI